MTQAQVLALEEELRQEEDLLKVKQKELQARREALILKQSRKEPRGLNKSSLPGTPNIRSKLKELEDEQQKEHALTEALKEVQQKLGADPRSEVASKEGQWLLRIAALEEELRQKMEKVKALRVKEQDLEAELRTRLHADSALLPALRLAAAEICAALQRQHGTVEAASLQTMPQMPVQAAVRPITVTAQPYQESAPAPFVVPPLPSCIAARVQDPAMSLRTLPARFAPMQSAAQVLPSGDPSRVPSPRKAVSTERSFESRPGTPVSRRSSQGGSDLKERWTTPVRRLDASLPAEGNTAIAATVLKTEPPVSRMPVQTFQAMPTLEAKRLEKPSPAVNPLTLPGGALAGFRGVPHNPPAAQCQTWTSPAAPACQVRSLTPPPLAPGTAGTFHPPGGARTSLPCRSVSGIPIGQTGLGFTPQTMPPGSFGFQTSR